ncbi:uncharacterized protein LOC6583143 [Drosophila mojavensis]|uniref:MADF domain-containing protein n=1 Tax=Drosophila mojavensis TaxID=7230 RepID=B4L1B5_DROMO|nr:uncharacterized protein LOC6583143 [Drosophila mojavensis]EDW19297.1 uncharacterized protein Dmoj_GI11601 [Drosophila mojavensis]
MNSRDRQFWTEFLELYRSLPAVWKVKSPEYSSRALKSAGYEQLVQKLREVEPDADRALVVKKINSFRTNFRRDLRKRDHCSDEEPFESTLWYFELLSFLEGQEEHSSCQILQKSSNFDLETPPELVRKKRRSAVKDEFPASPTAAELCSTVHCPTSPLRSPTCNRQQRKRLSTLSESEALAHTWLTQFEELAPRQKLLARKLISDVLYYGCMQQLEPCHVAQLQQMMMRRRSEPPQANVEDESVDVDS